MQRVENMTESALTLAEKARKAVFTHRTLFDNEPAHSYAAELVKNLAPHLQRVFFVSSGSEAVEVAMKLLSTIFLYSWREIPNPVHLPHSLLSRFAHGCIGTDLLCSARNSRSIERPFPPKSGKGAA